MLRIFSLIIGLLTLSPAWAAVTANNIITPQIPNRGVVQFLAGTDAADTYKTLYTAGANGSKCFAMWSNNNDASATHLITVQIINTAVKYGGMALTSVANAGYVSGTPAQALMTSALWPGLPIDSDGNPYMLLASGDTLQAAYHTALTATDWINITTVCSDF